MHLWLDTYSKKSYKIYFGNNLGKFDIKSVLDDIRKLLIWLVYNVILVIKEWLLLEMPVEIFWDEESLSLQ